MIQKTGTNNSFKNSPAPNQAVSVSCAAAYEVRKLELLEARNIHTYQELQNVCISPNIVQCLDGISRRLHAVCNSAMGSDAPAAWR